MLISNGCAAGNYYKETGEIYPHPPNVFFIFK